MCSVQRNGHSGCSLCVAQTTHLRYTRQARHCRSTDHVTVTHDLNL